MSINSHENLNNFLSKFRDPISHRFHSVTALQFFECWQHYDTDFNGYLEGEELTNFLHELISSVIRDRIGNEILSPTAFKQLTTEIMDAFDENQDGRIDINELVQILPIDESFLALFQINTPLSSSAEFIQIWRKYDTDMDGCIDECELKQFLQHLLNNSNMAIDDQQLNEYANVLLRLFDHNRDGKLQLNEMARLLRVKENYLMKSLNDKNKGISTSTINYIFQKYDLDNNGYLEGDELYGFIKDFIEVYNEGDEVTANRLEEIKQFVMNSWDKNNDGKIDKNESLTMILQIMHMLEEKDAIERSKD